MVIKEHKICVAPSEGLFYKQACFKVFDSTNIERAIAPPSDGSGSILYHSSIRSEIYVTMLSLYSAINRELIFNFYIITFDRVIVLSIEVLSKTLK